MSKNRIGALLYQLKRTGQEIVKVGGQLYSVDELLSMYYGRPVEPTEGHYFIQNGGLAA